MTNYIEKHKNLMIKCKKKEEKMLRIYRSYATLQKKVKLLQNEIRTLKKTIDLTCQCYITSHYKSFVNDRQGNPIHYYKCDLCFRYVDGYKHYINLYRNKTTDVIKCPPP